MQVPFLIKLAKKRGNAAHAGPGENIWSNVHIDDLVTLYALAIEKAPAGAFYFAENGENSMREVCEAINRMLGFAGPPSAMSMEEAAAEWGEGTAENTMASNSRVRAVRARATRLEAAGAELDRGDRAGVLSVVAIVVPANRDPYAAAIVCSLSTLPTTALWLWVPRSRDDMSRGYCFTPSHHAHVPDISW